MCIFVGFDFRERGKVHECQDQRNESEQVMRAKLLRMFDVFSSLFLYAFESFVKGNTHSLCPN